MRVYRYHSSPPIAQADSVRDQMWKAHRYKNRLIEIELQRREETAAVMRERFPELARLESKLASLNAAIDQIRAGMRKENAAARRRRVSQEDKQRLDHLKAERLETSGMLKAEKALAYESADMSELNAAHKARTLAARAECGVFWGTYLTVEEDLADIGKGVPPRFKRFDGHGRIGVQIQHGIEAAKCLAGDDTRLRLEATDDPRWRLLSFRIGTVEGKRDPIFATFRVRLHRPLPEDAIIKWAHVVRHRVATKDHWHVSFTVTGEPAREDVAPRGLCAVDVNWRRIGDGLRVASWIGDDGKTGDLWFSPHDMQRWDYSQSLTSIRDTKFNAMRARLAAWLRSHADILPEWLTESAKHLPQWRSANRMASLVLRWRGERFAGDEELWVPPPVGLSGKELHEWHKEHSETLLESWRKQDKHLYEWLANQRRKAEAWRQNLYRTFAATLRRQYAVVAVEDTNWATLAEHGPTECPKDDAATREYRREASVGTLIISLSQCGMRLVKVPAEMTTQRCHACRKDERFDVKGERVHTCRHCGVSWDQDDNARRNLLGLASEALARESQASLAGEAAKEVAPKRKRFEKREKAANTSALADSDANGE